MKILKRNYQHRNLLIFLMLSLVYLQSITSLSAGISVFSLESLKLFLLDHYLILVLTLIAGYLVTTLKKYSEIVVLLCLIAIVSKSFILLYGSFNKLTLVLDFIYLVFAFYYFVSWELEVGLACFNPNFSKLDLEKESRFKISGLISTGENNENQVNVQITNIDEESCFLLLPQDHSFDYTNKEYFLESNYEGVHFKQKGRLVSKYDRGIGLVFTKPANTRATWSDLYKVCLERGIVN
jgi:hypothetical protein